MWRRRGSHVCRRCFCWATATCLMFAHALSLRYSGCKYSASKVRSSGVKAESPSQPIWHSVSRPIYALLGCQWRMQYGISGRESSQHGWNLDINKCTCDLPQSGFQSERETQVLAFMFSCTYVYASSTLVMCGTLLTTVGLYELHILMLASIHMHTHSQACHPLPLFSFNARFLRHTHDDT